MSTQTKRGAPAINESVCKDWFDYEIEEDAETIPLDENSLARILSEAGHTGNAREAVSAACRKLSIEKNKELNLALFTEIMMLAGANENDSEKDEMHSEGEDAPPGASPVAENCEAGESSRKDDKTETPGTNLLQACALELSALTDILPSVPGLLNRDTAARQAFHYLKNLIESASHCVPN